MDLDDLRHALDEAALRHAPSDVSGARSVVGVRASRRRRRQRGFVSGALLAGAIAAIVIVLALAGGGSTVRAPSIATRPPAAYESLPARTEAAIAYDAARGDVVLFGGENLGGVRGDTWTWDGHGWIAMHPSVSPPALSGAVMAYDPRSRTVLMFGGAAPRDRQPTEAYNDLWSWDGTTWTQLHPQHEPPWSVGLAMSYDPASKSVILLTLPSNHPNVHLTPDSGDVRGATPFGTWSWDGSDWRELPTPTAPVFAARAAIHTEPRLVPLPHGRGLLFYSWAVFDAGCGGSPQRCGRSPDPTGTLYSQTFTWDGTRWTRQYPRRAPVAGRLVATPGADAVPTVFTGSAQWRWTGSDWRESRGGGLPSAVEAFAVYDQRDHDVVAYAGHFGTDGAFFDTWTWAGRWVRRDGPTDPLTTSTTVLAPSTTTTTAAPIRTCASSQLHLAFDKDLGSVMQQPGAFYALTNGSSVGCTLDGYPALQLFDASGRPVAVQQSNGGSYMIEDPGPHVVTVAPSATVYFGIGWEDAYMVQGGTTKGCISIGSTSVDLPGSPYALRSTSRLGEGFCPPALSVTAIAPKRAWALTASSP